VEPSSFEGPNLRCELNEINEFANALLTGEMFHGTDQNVQIFKAYPNQRRAVLALIWAEVRKQAGPGASIAFIVPSAAAAQELVADLRTPAATSTVKLPVHTKIETDEAKYEAFRLAALAAADRARQPSPANLRTLAVALAVFGQEWSRKTATVGRVQSIEKRLSEHSRAASPLREFLRKPFEKDLPSFAQQLALALEADAEFSSAGAALRKHGLPKVRLESIEQGSFFDEYRRSRQAVGLEGQGISPNKTTMLSMYKCKGREFDFVVMVVEPRYHSSKTSLDELRRLHYVTATRAKSWLGVLYVPNRAGPVLEPVLG
jgi:superfamily I DNA/RNA helicase